MGRIRWQVRTCKCTAAEHYKHSCSSEFLGRTPKKIPNSFQIIQKNIVFLRKFKSTAANYVFFAVDLLNITRNTNVGKQPLTPRPCRITPTLKRIIPDCFSAEKCFIDAHKSYLSYSQNISPCRTPLPTYFHHNGTTPKYYHTHIRLPKEVQKSSVQFVYHSPRATAPRLRSQQSPLRQQFPNFVLDSVKKKQL